MKKKNTILGVSDVVVMASFRKGVKDPDLLKKLSRRQPKMVKELFNMADRYANQEEAMTTANDDRPRQKEKKDVPSPPNRKIASARVMTWSRRPSAADHPELPARMTSRR